MDPSKGEFYLSQRFLGADVFPYFQWQKPIPVFQRRLFKYVPFAMRLHRWSMAFQVCIDVSS